MENQPDWIAFALVYVLAIGGPLVILGVHWMQTKTDPKDTL